MGLFSWFKGAKAGDAKRATPEPPKRPRKYTSVEIVSRPDASCEAVQQLAGKRFLAEEAPLFPLRDCDQGNCGCTYRRYPDRRIDLRRAADLGFTVLSKLTSQKDDRRDAAAPGRREADLRQR
jgi:hypothetical protein